MSAGAYGYFAACLVRCLSPSPAVGLGVGEKYKAMNLFAIPAASCSGGRGGPSHRHGWCPTWQATCLTRID